MPSDLLSSLDFTKRDEPTPGTDLRRVLTEWLDYQRFEFRRKLRDLSPEGLVKWSIPPVELSILGLVRHMQQMEHVYLSWGLGGGERVELYGDDDYAGGTVETVETDVRIYFDEIETADTAIAALPSLEAGGVGHGQRRMMPAAALVSTTRSYGKSPTKSITPTAVAPVAARPSTRFGCSFCGWC